MDDLELDDRIRKKAAKFEGEDYDPGAFSALRYRLESTNNMPFHVRYRTELLIASVVVLTALLILGGQWLIADANTAVLRDKMNMHEELVAALQQEIRYWKNLPPDTIRIIEKRDDIQGYQYLLNRIETLEDQLIHALKQNTTAAIADEVIPQNLSQDAGDLYHSNSLISRSRRLHVLHDRKNIRVEPRKSNTSQRPTPRLSAETMRDIEKHYHPGMGIKIGPAFEITNGLIKAGTGNLNTSAGILADFILSPSLSLESGLKYGHRDYSYDQPVTKNLSLPGTDHALGNLKTAEIDAWLIEVPLTLKYRYPFSLKTQAVAGLGCSSMIFRKQTFDYSYEYQGSSDIFVNAVHDSKVKKFYPASVSLSVGLSRQIKDQRLETSIGFQKGVHGFGLEETHADFVSIRTVLWFTVK